WPLLLSIRHCRSLFCVRLRLYPTVSPVKARTVNVHVLGEGVINVGVIDDSPIYIGHSGIVLECVSTPSSAPVTVSGVAKTVINAAVKTNCRSPVALVKHESAASPTPPSRGPKQTYPRRRDPHAWDPIIVVIIVVPTPVTRSPDIARDRTGRLHDYRQRRRSPTY